MPPNPPIHSKTVNWQRIHTRYLTALAALAVGVSGALAQSPRYTPPPPPTKNSTVELRLRYLLAPDISFQGLGTIPLRENYETQNNILLGTERGVFYDDGMLRQDYIRTSLVGGGADGAERVPSPDTAATSNFQYNSADQLDPNDPSALLFHRYASFSDPDVEFSGSSSGSLGWEINYTKYINRRRNLGLQVGFSFSGFDSRFNDSINADLYVQEFRHQMANGVIVPDLPDPVENADGSFTQVPYRGDAVRDDVASGNLLEWLAAEESEEWINEGATVDTKADLRSSIYNFRAGPTYSLALGRTFAVQVGAGISAIYFTGQFSAYEILQNPGGGENPSRPLTTTESNEWQVGGYVDASAHYYFSERVSLFSGAQVQSGSNYQQQNEERHASVDFSSQVYVHAGLGIRF
jgi:hypothetical protein